MNTAFRPSVPPSVDLAALVRAVPQVDLAAPPQGAAAVDPSTVVVHGVTLDSRTVGAGDLYAALPGAHVHGARFAAQAREAGAVAVLTDEQGARTMAEAGVDLPVLLADDPRAVLGHVSAAVHAGAAQALTMVGITGTNGKTTTAYLVESALRHLGRRTGLIGTIEIRVGDERVPSVRTTPESCDLHGLLDRMRQEEVDTCCMEVSSHALALHRVDGVVFDVAVFTNLSQDHLDFHPTMEDYFAAKASLFTPERARAGIVCVDDEWGGRLVAEAGVPVTTLVTPAAGPDAGGADWRLSGEPGEPRFVLTGPEGRRLELDSALPGDHNRINTALAALVLLQLGHAPEAVQTALAHGPRVPGRMERVELPTGSPRAFVDFAHTPEAIVAALRALRPVTPGRLVAVVGAGGDRDAGKRPAMGAAAAEGADVVVVTDDNPRTEDPATIRAAVLAGARDAAADAEVREADGRAEGIALALRLAGDDGTVAVLGKGHEQGQTIGSVTEPFDDVRAVQDAARALTQEVPGR